MNQENCIGVSRNSYKTLQPPSLNISELLSLTHYTFDLNYLHVLNSDQAFFSSFL